MRLAPQRSAGALLATALLMLAGCASVPYQAMKGQSPDQMRADAKGCWQAPTGGELGGVIIGSLLLGEAGTNQGTRIAAQRSCMEQSGYCSTRLYEPGYWTRTSGGGHLWTNPLPDPGAACRTRFSADGK